MFKYAERIGAVRAAACVVLVIGAGIANSAGPACTPPPSAMLAWYPAEGNANDIKGGNNGTLNGGVSFIAGEVGQAFLFDGSSGYVSTAPIAPGTQWTTEAWVMPTALPPQPKVTEVLGFQDQCLDYGLRFFWTGQVAATIRPPGGACQQQVNPGDVQDITSVTHLAPNTWYHVAATSDGSTARIYINGVQEASGPVDPGYVPGSKFRIGDDSQNGESQFFAGAVDEATVYGRALGPDEIAAIYNAGVTGKCKTQTCATPPPGLVAWYKGENNASDSQGGNTGTPQGGVSYVAGKVGNAFAFDGSTGSVSVPNVAALQLQTFSIDAWVQRSSASASTLDGADVAFFDYGAGGYGFGLCSGTCPQNHVFLTDVGISNIYSQNLTIADTAWHHVAVTSAAGQVWFYLDGVADGPYSYNPTYTFGSTPQIGGTSFNGSNFYGNIDELQIYNRALLAQEVAGIYSAGVNGCCQLAPLAPAQLAPSLSGSQLSLSWSAASGAASYSVFSGAAAGGESATPLLSGIGGTSSAISPPPSGTTAYYVVKAVNGSGTGAASNEVAVPAAPASLLAKPGSGSVSLSWGAVSGAQSYSVLLSGDGGLSPLAGGISGTSYTASGLNNGQSYSFAVAAVVNGFQGPPSNVASATPQAAPAVTVSLSLSPGPGGGPAAPQNTIYLGGGAVLGWTSTGASACSASGSWSGSQPLSGSFTVQPAALGSYTYTLACGNGGSGSATSSVTLTVAPMPAPAANISVTPSSITLGQAASLSWTSAYASSCSVSGTGASQQGLGGSVAVQPQTAGVADYTLSCSGPGGTTQKSAALAVNAAGADAGGGGSGGGAFGGGSLLLLAGAALRRRRRRARGDAPGPR